MKLNYLAFAVPLFLFFMALEYYWSKKKNKEIHQLNESIANLNVGIAERLTDLLTTGAFFFLFSWLHRHFALFHISASVLTWIGLFLFTDFLWYWYHRFGHRVNLFWAAHVVHHQSTDFNFTVSARITIIQAVIRGIFWSVLPIIGFPPVMITLFLLVHGAYPFFTHTQLIGKLGWLEYIIVTPSHHRVHHSSNEEYLDKNYGDMLIIWDKLFGTFAEEKSALEYGLTKPLNSHSFLWQHFHFFLEMGVAFRMAKSLKEKWLVLFGQPDNINPKIRPWLERKFSHKNADIIPTRGLTWLIGIQTLLTLVILFAVILFVHFLHPLQLGILSVFILLSVINTGAMMEQRSWVFHLDFGRLVLAFMLLYTFYPTLIVSTLSLIVLTGIICFYKSLQQEYDHRVYGFS